MITQDPAVAGRRYRMALLVLGSLMLLRLMTIGSPDLLDATEGRYASIAQDMWNSGNWITPFVRLSDVPVPFWGKPPFQFWITALSLGTFGMNEWAARFPSFLSAMLITLCTFAVARRLFDREIGILSALILWSAGLLNVLAGSTILDTTLAAAICATLSGFAMLYWPREGESKIWGSLLFTVAAAVGFLTKGPVALVLSGAVIVLFALLVRSWRAIKVLPWLWGVPLLIALTLPWFLLAEHATPGFLRYFFVEENFRRFTSASYNDLYGNGHRYPHGSSWWMLWVAFLPWSLFSISLLSLLPYRNAFKEMKTRLSDERILFCVIWGLVPALFFTMARQILITYMLPALPGLAIVTALVVMRVNSQRLAGAMKWLPRVVLAAMCGLVIYAFFSKGSANAGVIGLVLTLSTGYIMVRWSQKGFCSQFDRGVQLAFATAILLVVVVLAGSDKANNKKSTKRILQYVQAHSPERQKVEGPLSIGIFSATSYSAFFYSNAQVPKKFSVVLLEEGFSVPPDLHDILVRSRDIEKLPSSVREVAVEKAKLGAWTWLRVAAGPS